MPPFINLHKQRVGANVNKDVDLSGFGEAVARTVNNQKLKSFNSSMADIAQRAVSDPHGASVDAFRAGNQQFGTALLNHAVQGQNEARKSAEAEKLKLANTMASGAFQYTKPEEWAGFVTSLEQRYGRDLSKYKPIAQREVVLSEALTLKQRMDAGFKNRELGLRERGLNLDERKLSQKTSNPQSMAGFKLPNGYRFAQSKDGKPVLDDSGRPAIEPIPNGPATKEAAGSRKSFAEQGLSTIKRVRGFFKNKRGFTDRIDSVFNRGEAGRINRDVKLSIEAILRAATGAAAPEYELKTYLDIFQPSFDDTQKTALDKLDRLELLARRIMRDSSVGRMSYSQLSAMRQEIINLETKREAPKRGDENENKRQPVASGTTSTGIKFKVTK